MDLRTGVLVNPEAWWTPARWREAERAAGRDVFEPRLLDLPVTTPGVDYEALILDEEDAIVGDYL